MALQATKAKKLEKVKCLVATPAGEGVVIDHKIRWRGEAVTPEDVGMTNVMLAEGQLVKAGSRKADLLLKAVDEEKKGDKKKASATGHLSLEEGNKLESDFVEERKRGDSLAKELAKAKAELAKLEE